MKIRKMISALVVACMMVGTCTTAFAAENTSWKNYDYSKYISSWSGSSAGSNSSGSSAGTNGWSWSSGSNWGSGWGTGSGSGNGSGTGSGTGNGSGWSWGSGSGSGSGWSWGDGWTWGGSNTPGSGNDETVEEDTSLPAPEIGECRFIHQTLNAPDCLVIDWSDVEGAASYEMEMCYSDCEVIATYTMENSRFSVPAGRDDKNVSGCCRGRKIRVRAIDADGNPGKWSDYDTVGCNAIRG